MCQEERKEKWKCWLMFIIVTLKRRTNHDHPSPTPRPLQRYNQGSYLHKRIHFRHRWSRIRHILEAKQFASSSLLFQLCRRTRYHSCVRGSAMITVSQLLETFDDSLPVIVISKDLKPVNEHKTIACQWRNSNIPVDRAGISPSRTLCIVVDEE